MGRNNRDKEWRNVNSLFMQRFRCRFSIRRRIVKFLSVRKDIAQETGSRFVPQNNPTVQFDTNPTRCHVYATRQIEKVKTM